jgi:cytochrome c oxidase subunit 2
LENVTVNKFWALVFGVVLAACGGSFFIAPAMGWWLPEGVSSHSWDVDFLFYVILWITGFFFFLTEAILVGFLFLYGSSGTPKPPRASGWPAALKPLEGVLHDSHRVEMAWTVVPALILLYIAFAQIGTWAEVKYQKNMPEFGKNEGGKVHVPLQVDVSARQFEWRVRYPSYKRTQQWFKGDKADKADFDSFAKVRQADDVDLVNEVHTWKDEPTVVYLTTRDVIHSFNVPMMRVKQDALPGKVIPVWFVPRQANTVKVGEQFLDGRRFKVKKVENGIYEYQQNANGTYEVDDKRDHAQVWDIPCAELCGWGHYRMIGRIYVHPDRAQFMDWLNGADKAAHADTGSR